MSDKHYKFRSAKSTTIILKIREALNNKFSPRIISLDIWMFFDKVWYLLSSYWISGTAFSAMKAFLIGRSLEIAIRRQSSEAHETHAEILDSTVFVFSILIKNILRNLLNIYYDNITFYIIRITCAIFPRFYLKNLAYLFGRANVWFEMW